MNQSSPDIEQLADELERDYPAVDVTSVVFSRDFAGVGCCVIPQDRVLAVIAALRARSSAGIAKPCGNFDPEKKYTSHLSVLIDAVGHDNMMKVKTALGIAGYTICKGDGVAQPSPDRFKITWNSGAYYVSIPNYQGGEVVGAEIFDALEVENTNLRIALKQANDRQLEAESKLATLAQPSPLRMCGMCHTWNSKPCGEQCGLQSTDPTYEQVAFANAAEAVAISSTERQGE